MMTICCDIVDDLFRLEEHDITIACGAINWKRIPTINPEEITNISIADKIFKFDAKFAFIESALSDIKIENVGTHDRIARIEQCWSEANMEWPPLRPNVTPVKLVSSPSGLRDHAHSLGSSNTNIPVRHPVPANLDTTDTTDHTDINVMINMMISVVINVMINVMIYGMINVVS